MPFRERIIKIKNYFAQQPTPRSAFCLSSHYLSGIHVSQREERVKYHFILPLEGNVIRPSFIKRNLQDASLLEKKLKQGMRKLHLSDQKIGCLIPELSLKTFVFSFDSLPPSLEEKKQIILFRIKKQIPFLPDDVRFSFNIIRSDHSKKILVSVARASVIKEYEDLFWKLRLKVRAAGSPTLCLYNVVSWEKEKDFILINVEEESLCLMAGINSEIVLYRQKPFGIEGQPQMPLSQKIEHVVKEIESTVNFLEDREKGEINSLLIRLGLVDQEEEMLSGIREKLPFPLKGIDVSSTSNLSLKEKQILSPLIGQIL